MSRRRKTAGGLEISRLLPARTIKRMVTAMEPKPPRKRTPKPKPVAAPKEKRKRGPRPDKPVGFWGVAHTPDSKRVKAIRMPTK